VEVDRYLAARRPSLKPRSYIETERHLRQHAKPLHSLALTEINRRAIAVLLERIATGSGLVARNRVRASLSAFFTWIITEGLLEANPVTGTAKANEGGSRSRVLTDAELALIWRSLGDDRYGNIVRLLILTGQRREEIGGLCWSEVLAAQAGGSGQCGSIILPPERTKNSQEHKLPLSAQARAIIDRQPRRNSSPFIFDRSESGFGWSFYKAQLDARIAAAGATIPAWRLHDLRRTVATGMADKLGISPWVIEAVLNHISGHKSGVAGIYNRAKYEAEMRDALTRWGDYISALVAPAPDGQTAIAIGAPALATPGDAAAPAAPAAIDPEGALHTTAAATATAKPPRPKSLRLVRLN
jgi:integrase